MRSLVMAGLVLGLIQSGVAQAHTVVRAKAAELSLHRIEKLVVLKKIEEGFLTKARTLSLVPIAHATDTDPAFKATISQVAGADGTQRKVEITMNEEGKAQTYVVADASEPVSAPVWPDRDSITLAENSLHFVEEGAVTKPELVPYNEKLESFTLSAGTNAQGEQVAIIDIGAEGANQTLRVRIKLNGDFDSSDFIAKQ